METVPFTDRKHFVLFPSKAESWVGEQLIKCKKNMNLRGKILPPEHPKSFRVMMISSKIISTLGTRWNASWEVTNHEVTRDLRVCKNWMTHLRNMNWEVIVVDEPRRNAYCLPGGKIVCYSGMLDYFTEDAEIAAIIGHEIGHAVARHPAEDVTKHINLAIPRCLLYPCCVPSLVNAWYLYQECRYHHMRELEADYIGLLLMASAGYDPRVAVQIHMKFGLIYGAYDRDSQTHPSEMKRAMFLSQDKFMNEALSIYFKVLEEYEKESLI